MGKQKIKKRRQNKNETIINSRILWFFLALLFLSSAFFAKNFGKALIDNYSNNSALSIRDMTHSINFQCRDSDEKDQCYGNAFYEITKKHNQQFAISVLEELQKINPQDANGCHFMAHKISQAEVEKNPEEWQKNLIEISPSLCTGGFLHGIIEAHMATDPSFTINEQSFKDICDNVYTKHRTWFAWRGCVHNMGHLMLVQTEGNIERAVSSCDEINKTETKYECLSGAFMERITGENLIAHGILEKRTDWMNEEFTHNTEQLCAQYKSAMPARTCWKVISYLYFATSNHDPRGLYEKCQRAPEKNMRDECFIYGAGNMVVTTRFDQADLYNVCHQFPPNHHLFTNCMNQIIGSLLTSSLNNKNKVLSLCSQTYNSHKEACYARVIDTLKMAKAPNEVLNKTCKQINATLKTQLCRG
jgi:hypothetical protein